jgi:D-alanyl-D-alanine carboxypeptidase/D-alanyl-D-alanine-endopeptidase (penicillin-binding protein 4)
MNLYSNNFIAESLARSLGGSDRVVAVVREKTQIDPSQIQLINGSGLGVDNRIAAEAVAEIFMTLERELKSQGVSVTDLFPVSGRDKIGTLQGRYLPLGVAVKTGTLAQVSALAGMIPTQERGSVWFTIINSGGDIEALRREQDRLLQDLSKHWRLTPQPGFLGSVGPVFLGDPARNIKSSSPGLFLDRK